MRFDDTINGLIAVAAGAFLIFWSQGFEPVRHISYGPGFFPTLIGLGLVGAGVVLIGGRLLARAAATSPRSSTRTAASGQGGAGSSGPLAADRFAPGSAAEVVAPERACDTAAGDEPVRRSVLTLILFLAAVLAYISLVEWLGFLLTLPPILFVLLAWLGNGILRSAALAVAATIVLQLFFQQLMSVPLPWGVLEPFAGRLTF